MYRDRVWETATTTGTGNFTLLGVAEEGYQTFSAAFGTSPAYYVIVNRSNPAQWEIGSFTVNAATLTRTNGNVLAGSAGAGAKVNFTAGIKDIYNSPPAAAMQNWVSNVASSPTDPTGGGILVPLGGNGYMALRKSGNTVTLHAWNCANCNCDCNCYC